MSKKKKKKSQEQRIESREKSVHKADTRDSNIKIVQCIECLRDRRIKKKEECQACELHDNGFCKFAQPKKAITALTYASPMRFNRNFFQMSSDNLREASLNYYFVTDILNDVKNIKDYPNYRQLKSLLLQGKFKKDKVKPELKTITAIEPIICLSIVEVSDNKTFMLGKHDLLFNGLCYKICEPFEKVIGYWTVYYYMYRVYELDGFGDIEINGQPYNILFHQLDKQKPDLILAMQEDKIIIGRMIDNA